MSGEYWCKLHLLLLLLRRLKVIHHHQNQFPVLIQYGILVQLAPLIIEGVNRASP